MRQTENINVRDTVPLISPRVLHAELPASPGAIETVVAGREAVQRILSGDDHRLLVVVGPCSIHDHLGAFDYARRLQALAAEVADRMFIVMRVYFEKPRTTVGWKGLINDPHLDDTFHIPEGLRMARRLLLELNEMGLPAATEMLEPITPQYIADLIAWASIGARTTESPTHRQLASGLSMPVGYKNGTDGSLEVAVNAMQAARSPHSFLGIDFDGHTCIINTTGNPWGHLILRGGHSGPNYDLPSLRAAERLLQERNLPARIMVDCSHANSNKDYRRQSVVWNAVIEQRLPEGGVRIQESGARGQKSVPQPSALHPPPSTLNPPPSTLIGLMLESNLFPGNQKLPADLSKLEYGVSITDGCIGWDETERLIRGAYERLNPAAITVRSLY